MWEDGGAVTKTVSAQYMVKYEELFLPPLCVGVALQVVEYTLQTNDDIINHTH